MEVLEKSPLTITGTIKSFKANKHGDIDSFELDNDGQILKINFPPHTARIIKRAVNEGDSVELIYKEEQPKNDPKGDKKPKNKLESITPKHAERVIIKDIKPVKPAGENPETFSIKDFELVKGKKGELVGIKTGDKLFHIHKDDEEFADKITKGTSLEITAVERKDDGFINQDGDKVYHIKTIVINGTTYKSKK